MRQQTVFLFIALLYFLYKIASFFLFPSRIETSSVIPGWHTLMEYRPLYSNSLTVVYFLAVAAIYGLGSRLFTKTFFRAHAVLSIVPLCALMLWPLFFNRNDPEIHNIHMEYQVSELLEWFFLISQATFIILMIVKNSNAQMRSDT